jgi:thioredoxin-like negative regulator of GroEL
MENLTQESINNFIEGSASVVAFHASWCPFCRRFMPAFRAFEGKTKARMAEAQVDEEDNPLWDRFKIEVVPTMIAFKDGKPIDRRDGKPGAGLSEKDIESLLESVS